MIHRRSLLVSLIVLAFAAPLPAVGQSKDATFKHRNDPKNLKALFELLHHTVHVKKDAKQAAALLRSLIPDEARVKKALKEDVEPETLRQIVEQQQKAAGLGKADVVKLARPEQKVVTVYAATTEEIAKYQEGSVAFKVFPGGARRLAEQVLRPGVTFYEVEFLDPGNEAGIKYHLVYWDGKQWSMLGPMWRIL